MDREKPEAPRPTTGEQLGGVIGCIALLLALLLLVWLSSRGLWEAAARR
jgi:hypothetical protein